MPPADVGFGRKVAIDPRDLNYPMSLKLAPAMEQFFPRGIPPGARHFLPAPPIIVQGNTGTCVAHGCTSYINAPPYMQKLPVTPFNFYRRVVGHDEFPENDFEATAPDAQLQYGTSVRAGVEELRAMGYVKNYLWAQSTEDARGWMLAGLSGLIGGFNWKTDMMDTDTSGFVHYSGNVEGGHCFYIGGWNDHLRYNGRYVRAARCQQSWPLPWGQGGRFWILEDDLAKMLQDQGELAAPTEVRVEPLKVAETPEAGGHNPEA